MELASIIEALLFISHKPLSVKELTKLTELSASEVTEALTALTELYKTRNGGLMILEVDGSYQLGTSGAAAPYVERMLKHELDGELTRPSLETLTIIAYRGPISKAELELIRGVNCSMIIRNLLMRGLITAEEDTVRATTVYQITHEFLKHLGMSRAADLPDFERLNRDHNLDALLAGTTATDSPQESVTDQANV